MLASATLVQAAPVTFDVDLSFDTCVAATTTAGVALSPSTSCSVTGSFTMDLGASHSDASLLAVDLTASVGGALPISYTYDWMAGDVLPHSDATRLDVLAGDGRAIFNSRRLTDPVPANYTGTMPWQPIVVWSLNFALETTDMVEGTTSIGIRAGSMVFGLTDFLFNETNAHGSGSITTLGNRATLRAPDPVPPVSPVPLPASFSLVLAGGASLMGLRHARRKLRKG